MSYADHFKASEKFIALILKDNEKAREDDRELILAVWEKQGLRLTEQQKYMFRKVMSPETIRRSRQKIQEFGFYRPDPAKYEQRQLLAEDTRRNI